MCSISETISPAFHEVHRAIKTGAYSEYVLKGGRASGKSSFAAIEGVLFLLQNPWAHGAVVRKVKDTLRTTVYPQYEWALDILGVREYFCCTKSLLEMVYKPTGQKMMFFGGDDPHKLKSLKPPFGYVGFLHLEEMDNFAGQEDVRSIEQSVLCGGPVTLEIKTFNPPRARLHWLNRQCESPKPGQLIHHSDYRQCPKHWLGERFLKDALHLKQTNYAAYEHEYLGFANRLGSAVFDNIATQRITDGQIQSFERILCGVDWGYHPDPWAYNRVAYDAAHHVLYVLEEAEGNRMTNRETAAIVRASAGGATVFCDSSEPKSVDEYLASGIRAIRVKKGAGSVAKSYAWMQGLHRIVIDPQRCPKTYGEFSTCEASKGGGVSDIRYPDTGNHHIDAVRYATQCLWG